MPFHALDLDSRAEYLNHLLASIMFYRRFQSSRVANWVGSSFVPPCAPKVHSNAIENDIFPRLLEGGTLSCTSHQSTFANHTIVIGSRRFKSLLVSSSAAEPGCNRKRATGLTVTTTAPTHRDPPIPPRYRRKSSASNKQPLYLPKCNVGGPFQWCGGGVAARSCGLHQPRMLRKIQFVVMDATLPEPNRRPSRRPKMCLTRPMPIRATEKLHRMFSFLS
jgi:hypothetical protein